MRLATSALLVIASVLTFSSGRTGATVYTIRADGFGTYATIQDAIDVSVSGDTILLTNGTYTGAGNRDIDFGGRGIVVVSESGPDMCTIDCGGSVGNEHRGFHFHSMESSDAVVDGITITNGRVELTDGGGILIENGSSPVIRNCRIENNLSAGSDAPLHYSRGGGIAVYNSSPSIIDNVIATNSTELFQDQGGGIYLYSSGALVMGNVITGNFSCNGGGISAENSPTSIIYNHLEDNMCDGVGAGIYIEDSFDTGNPYLVHNNIIISNQAVECGGIATVSFATTDIRNCTIVGNDGGGIYGTGQGGTATDCILYLNTDYQASGAVTAEYCWVEGGYSGTGNITGSSIAFESGPLGNHYIPAGNECENSGSDLASNITFADGEGEFNLDEMTVFALQHFDTGQVDIGYHYRRANRRFDIPADFATIQEGIDHSVDGDSVALAWQTFYEDIDFHGRNILVYSPGTWYWPPEIPTIEGSGSGPVVTFHGGETNEAELRGCYIRGGDGTHGGGVSIRDSSPHVNEVYIYNCTATFGGGVYVFNGSPRLRNMKITDNTAQFGGGVYVTYASPELYSNQIGRNTSTWSSGGQGGGIYINESAVYINNNAVFDNVNQDNGGTGSGGGIFIRGASSNVTMTNVTIANNTASDGSGIFVENGTAALDKTIIALGWGGEAACCTGTGSVTLSCCDVYCNEGGDFTGCIAGLEGESGNFSADPLFCDPSDDFYGISWDSPCFFISACGGRIGGGSFMTCTQHVTMVFSNGSGDFPTIQAAVDGVAGGGIIQLADGTFSGPGNRDVDFGGKSITVRSLSGDPENCIIDCGGGIGEPYRGFILNEREGHGARIEGITIRNGWTGGSGGGINLTRSHATIKNCIFEKCHANDGGGMSTYMSEGLITDCGFDSCTADNAGGGIFNHTSNPTIRDCYFIENWANWGGGGLYNHYSSPYTERCAFAGNTSDHWGGGVHNNHPASMPTLQNCTFSRNAAPVGGGMFSRNFAAPVVYNSIIAFSEDGVAVHTQTDATTTLYCCDVYGNDDGDYVGGIVGQDGANGNFSADPLFCNELIHYLRLTESSPCTQENTGSCGLIGAIWENCHPTTDVEETDPTPTVTRLFSCFPNPFNPATRIAFDLSSPGHVSLRIYDAAGRLVRILVDENRKSGRFEEVWNGTDNRGGQVASGVYFYRLTTSDFVNSKKMILLQ